MFVAGRTPLRTVKVGKMGHEKGAMDGNRLAQPRKSRDGELRQTQRRFVRVLEGRVLFRRRKDLSARRVSFDKRDTVAGGAGDCRADLRRSP